MYNMWKRMYKIRLKDSLDFMKMLIPFFLQLFSLNGQAKAPKRKHLQRRCKKRRKICTYKKCERV